ncbi:hypothetical protein [Nocardioides montaniterrae]
MSIDVDLGVLATIATSLDKGASGLDGLDATAATGVDAGPMTAVIAGMLSQVLDSAGNISDVLTATAGRVRECRTYYQRADASAAADLEAIHKAMTP